MHVVAMATSASATRVQGEIVGVRSSCGRIERHVVAVCIISGMRRHCETSTASSTDRSIHSAALRVNAALSQTHTNDRLRIGLQCLEICDTNTTCLLCQS